MNAIAYMRFSPRPNGQHSESIDFQRTKIRSYCAVQNWTILSEHEDRMKSGGKIDGRPGLAAAMAAACASKGVLVVYSLSRFSRSTKDAIDLTGKLEKCGADLCSITEKLDTSSPMGRALFSIMAAMGQLERETTGERTRAALKWKREAGERTTRYAPYGYSFVDGKIETNLAEQCAIDCITTLHVQGYSARQICRVLTENKHPCRAEAWNHNLVCKIIRRALPSKP